MAAWEELVKFARGTRERPPPGPKRPAATALLVASSLLHLPLVYLLVRAEALPVFPILIGALSMGLAWAGGVSLEGRRAGTVRMVATLGILEGALALIPSVAELLGSARWVFLVNALLCGAALLVSTREGKVANTPISQ